METNIIQDYLNKNVIFFVLIMCANGKNQIYTDLIQHNVRLGAYYIAKWHILRWKIYRKSSIIFWIEFSRKFFEQYKFDDITMLQCWIAIVIQWRISLCFIWFVRIYENQMSKIVL